MKQKIITFGRPGRYTVLNRAQAKAASSRRRKRRRTGRHILHYLLILLVASVILVILSLTIFFKIEKISVVGTTKYAEQEIIGQSGVKIGDNLFSVSEKKLSATLTEKFPYVEAVTLKRAFPPRLTIEVTQAKPLGAVDTQMGYVVIGRGGKVLEIGAPELPEDMMVVAGMYLYNPRVGKILGEGYQKEELEEADKEAEAFKMLTYLVDAVEHTEFDGITLVDFSDRLNMMIVYENRIMIELGSEMNLEYKLRFVKRVIMDELESNFEGVLDVSIDKEVWAKPADIQEELEKRRLAVSSETQPSESENVPLNPELEVIPGSSNPAADGSSSRPSESEQPQSNSESGAVSSFDELEVIPNSSSPTSAGD